MYLKLKDGELSNALQFLCMSSRKGELSLTFESGKTGNLFLSDNSVVHAQFEAGTGVKAVALMLSQGGAETIFHEGRPVPTRSIELPISQLLLEAAVMSDEVRAGKTH